MKKNTEIIEGTPFESGSLVWQKMVLPFLSSVQGQPKKAIGQFYMGILSAFSGSMCADFDAKTVASALRELADQVEMVEENGELH